MVVTITVAELAEANRIGSTTREQNEVSRIRDYCIVAIAKHLGAAYEDCPETVVNMATTLTAGYYYDKPTVAGGISFANAFKFGGGIRVLFPYRVIGAGLVGGDAVAEARSAGMGSPDNAVVDVDVDAGQLVITFADGTEERHDLPAAGVFGVDQTARDSAATAQTAADTAQTAADTVGVELDEHETNHPSGGSGVDQTARDAADANATAIALRLQRADVSPGVGIAITPTAGSQTGLTISSSSGTGNVTLTGAWTWVALTPAAGEIMPTDSVVPPAIDTWIFNATGGQYANDRTALLSAAIGDTLEIVQSPTRFQVITLTEVPTLNQFTDNRYWQRQSHGRRLGSYGLRDSKP